jgi:hypothetical protein
MLSAVSPQTAATTSEPPPAAHAEASAAPAKSSRRIVELDVLRGFLLLWMAFTHLPTKASIISNQTFGFVSGAEGFIFLAAFMVGWLEYRVSLTRGERGVVRDIGRRTLRIYVYHCALLIVAFSLVSWVAVAYNRVALENLLSFYLERPHNALIAGGILTYQPSLFDILPMYIIFMLVTLAARRVAQRFGWKAVLVPSFAIWLAAQFGLRHWMYLHVNLFGLSVPENSTGAFDIWGWQFLWMVGLALGSVHGARLSAGRPSLPIFSEGRLPGWLLKALIVLAAVLCVLRYSPAWDWIDPRLYGWLIDKWRLGPVRVVNFAVLMVLVAQYGRRIAAWPVVAPLAALGQASIEVFSVHVLCCLAGHALSRNPDPILPASQQILLLVGTVAVLFATAHLQRRRTARRRLRRRLASA